MSTKTKGNPAGQIVVRTVAANTINWGEYDIHIPNEVLLPGYIFRAGPNEANSGHRAYFTYNDRSFALEPYKWRYATEKEKNYYLNGGTNIIKLVYDYTIFKLYMHSDKTLFAAFRSSFNTFSCLKNEFFGFNGCSKEYHKKIYGKISCSKHREPEKFDIITSSPAELFKYFYAVIKDGNYIPINKHDEIQKTNTITAPDEGQRDSKPGKIIFSNRKRQTTIGSRCIGNATSYKHYTGRVASSKIKGNIISF